MTQPQYHKLRKMIDEFVNGIPDKSNSEGHFVFRENVRKAMYDLTLASMQDMAEQVYQYGRNTHTASAVEAYVIEWRRAMNE